MNSRRSGAGRRLAVALVIGWMAIALAFGSTTLADQSPASASTVGIVGGVTPR